MNLLILAIYTETEYWSVVGGQLHSSSNLGLLLNLSAACDLHRFSLSDFFSPQDHKDMLMDSY